MRTVEGSQSAGGFRFALVVSKYHDFVTDRLQAGAVAALAAAGVRPDDVTVVRVPGASVWVAWSEGRRLISMSSPRPWPTA